MACSEGGIGAGGWAEMGCGLGSMTDSSLAIEGSGDGLLPVAGNAGRGVSVDSGASTAGGSLVGTIASCHSSRSPIGIV